ncbi:hypothetical protein [Streptomyces sp. NPDC003247]|uniref:hypothetical protein n=1 Tax=Streptomyces sp. NPDC003247 TaxID=3364677 RepID=UPI003699DD37
MIGNAFRVPGGSSVLTDGCFTWRLDLASYVQHHSIALPQEFLTFIEGNEFRVPPLEQEQLIEITLLVNRVLGFRTDPGAGPHSAHGR